MVMVGVVMVGGDGWVVMVGVVMVGGDGWGGDGWW